MCPISVLANYYASKSIYTSYSWFLAMPTFLFKFINICFCFLPVLTVLHLTVLLVLADTLKAGNELKIINHKTPV
jgi:hypothetical protein